MSEHIKLSPTMFKLLTFISICLHLSSQNDCRLNTTILQQFQRPLFVYEDTLDFIYPTTKYDKSITIREGKSVLVSCGSANFSDSSIKFSTISVSCDKNQFKSNNEEVDVHNLECTDDLDIAENTPNKCAENATIIKVGYPIDIRTYLIMFYEVCFDYSAKNVLWVKYQPSKISRYSSSGTNREDKEFFNLTQSVDYYYIDEVKKRTINELVGLPEKSDKYIGQLTNTYTTTLATKNYVANNYFYFGHQHRALAHFIETAPLWKSVILFEDDNWNQMETQLYTILGKTNQNPPQIIVGSYGVDTLPHEDTGESIELYLDLEEDDGFKKIPVPKLSWQLIYDSLKYEAVVFVSVDNVFYSSKDNVICQDVFDNVTIFDLKNRTDIKYRYTYACTYEDFKKTVTYVPDLNVTGLLTKLSNSANSYFSGKLIFILSGVFCLLHVVR